MSLSEVVAASQDTPFVAPAPVTRLRDLTATQWKSGAAAWLGWMFDGLDMHLYTLVAAPFVAELLAVDAKDASVGLHASWIQGAFLVGWALGGSVFGRLGDKIGRSRALVLTILTYAAFTGLSFFAQAWWQLMLFRFLAALGIGGEWAVGAALLSETWPHRWKPWLAAILQTAVNIGIILATVCVAVMSGLPPRYVFLIGVLPALLVLWIRRAVPEPDEWHRAKQHSAGHEPKIRELFAGNVRRTTWLTMAVCGFSLSGHWALMFWCSQHLRRLPAVQDWTDAERVELVSQAMAVIMVMSIVGNFLAAAIARWIGYRRTIIAMCAAYFVCMMGAYAVPRDPRSLMTWLAAIGVCQGVFALFSMYLPPLFPTLLRTTGAGFCFNIGRMAAALVTIFLASFASVDGYRHALLGAGTLFVPATFIALFLPETRMVSSEVPEPVE